MRRLLVAVAIAAFAAALTAAATPAAAQLGGLKDRAKKKAQEKVEKKLDQKKASADTAKAAETAAPAKEAETAAGGAATPAGGSATAEDMTLFTKYDFVPGDKVIFYDDLSKEELGEFPSRWDLDHGVFEIASMHGQNWVWCTDRGRIFPKVAQGPLPEKYTVELEFFANPKDDGWLSIHWYDGDNQDIGYLQIGYDTMTSLHIMDKDLAEKTIPRLPVGKHVMRIMATTSTIKCYIDQVRIANVPKVEGFAPVRLSVDVDPYFGDHDPMLTGAFRYAEGGKTLKEQLDETGRVVTHGILFDSGSAKIKADSYKTLADIGALLTGSPDLRVSIEGHTDSDGSDEANMKLSQDRAASVRTYLIDTFKIDGSRLEAKGWGESKPIDTNDTPEGKANNRRVELVKL